AAPGDEHHRPVRCDRYRGWRRPEGPGGRGPPRQRPGARAVRREAPAAAQEGGAPDAGSPDARAEEVRSTRRAAKVPVFEALVPKRRDVVRVAVAGASGYMGAELLRLLLGHPRITVTGVPSERLAGEPLGRAYPHLRGLTELAFHDLDAEWLAGIADAVFLALPHLESQRVVPVLRRRGVRAIDLSADYRLRDPNDYVTWYKAPHTDLAGLAEAVYGLPELHRNATAGFSPPPPCPSPRHSRRPSSSASTARPTPASRSSACWTRASGRRRAGSSARTTATSRWSLTGGPVAPCACRRSTISAKGARPTACRTSTSCSVAPSAR